MRFRFSQAKSETLRRNPKRGIGFEEALGDRYCTLRVGEKIVVA